VADSVDIGRSASRSPGIEANTRFTTGGEPSKDTTFLTGRTLPDGLLDFSAALWHHCNTPVNDVDNAAIPLRELEAPEELLIFLSRYSMEQAENSEQASEIFALIAQEQGFGFIEDGIMGSLQAIRLPWTAKQFPAVAELLDRNVDYIQQWKEAINRPAISKPIGTTLDELQRTIQDGSNHCFVHGMMYAGEGNWAAAVENFEVVDQAADHLCRLQCGWMLHRGLRIRNDISLALVGAVRTAESIDPRFAAYIRHTDKWPVGEVAINAVDNDLRVRAQTDVRDMRDQETGRLHRWLGGGLIGTAEAQQLQVTTLRNSIDWESVARVQNEAIDESIAAMATGNLMLSMEQHKSARLARNESRPRMRMIKTIQQFTGEDISVPLAWSLVIRYCDQRIAMVLTHATEINRMQRMAVCSAAIAEFRKEHQRWPFSVLELPNREDTIDPLTGEPFIYEISPDDQCPRIRNRRSWSFGLHL
jgi:hypothetical protein